MSPGLAGKLDAWVAVLARGLESEVRAGENRGRRLRHDFVAVALLSTSMQSKGESYFAETTLPGDSVTVGSARALAVWVAPAGQLVPLQALG